MCISNKIRPADFSYLFLACVLLLSSSAHSTVIAKSHSAQNKSPVPAVKSALVGTGLSLAEPVAIEKQFPVEFTKYGAKLQAVTMSWEPLGLARFEAANGEQSSFSGQQGETVITGNLSWRVSASRTQVLDRLTGKSASIADLTSAEIRAKEIIFNERLGVVWFYGQSIYRYHIQSKQLARLQTEDENLLGIRKLLAGPNGLWFAANGGIFHLDETGSALNKISHSVLEGVNIINAAVSEKEILFVSSAAKLIRIQNISHKNVDIAVSSGIAAGVPAEFINSSLSWWMLLSQNHGEYYKLAYLDKEADKVNVIAGKYFSLSESGGQLMAKTYAAAFRIDPLQRTITKLNLTIPGTLERAASRESVLFIGSSYAYKDNCEIVERGAIDISRGWIQSLLKSTLLFQ